MDIRPEGPDTRTLSQCDAVAEGRDSGRKATRKEGEREGGRVGQGRQSLLTGTTQF